MKARKSTNLNSSTSSLDSALCMDSASSMEPSPVSSASSSFSPAPSTTTRSTSSTVSTSSSNLSQPEDMKKVNEKLISTLATDRLIADSANKTRGESSPTSTNSSTSTLKGDESAENIPGLVQDVTSNKADANVKRDTLVKKDSTDGSTSPVVSGHSRSFEGPTFVTKTYTREPLLSDSEKSPSFERRSKTPLSASSSINTLGDRKDYLTRSYTVDRRRETLGSKSGDRDTPTSYNSSTLGRSGRGLSKQAAEELLALDPKTVQSLERLKKLTSHKRPTTPEPLAPPISEVKVLHSPDRQHRRKSEGMHPIEKQVGANFKPIETTLHEGDESEHNSDKEEERNEATASTMKGSETLTEEKMKEDSSTVSAPPTPTVKTGGSTSTGERSSSPKSESASSKRVTSPTSTSRKNDSEISKRVASPTSTSRKNESDVGSVRTASPTAAATKNDIIDSKRTTSPVKGYQRSFSEKSPSEIERKTPTSSSSRLTSSRMENGDKSPTPKKRISSSSSNEDATSKPVSISSFTRSTPIDRMWSDFKKEDNNGSKIRTSPRSSRYQQSQNSTSSLNSNNDSPTHNRRKYVTRERFVDDGGSFKIKASSVQGGVESSPQTSSLTKRESKEDTKSAKRSSPTLDREKESIPSRTRSPPGVAINGEPRKITPKVEEAKKETELESSPRVGVRSPNESKGESSKSNYLEEKRASRDVRVRQKSPVSDRLKVIKANRRKTPVISEDALAAILSGDIPDEDGEEGPLSPSQIGERRMTLETCPEEDEEAATKQTSSPGRKNILKQSSSLDQPASHHHTPEKKVTIEPCSFRRVGKKPMLSAEMRERTKSLTSFSPERSLSPTSPSHYSTIQEEGSDLSKSSNLLALPKTRLRVSSMVMSRSTPDLSEILEPKRKSRKARRIERSNSKRRVRVDSYVTSTTPNATFSPVQATGSYSAPKSTRRLSGSRFSKFASAFSRKDKDQSEKDSNSKQSEKEKGSKRW